MQIKTDRQKVQLPVIFEFDSEYSETASDFFLIPVILLSENLQFEFQVF